MKQYNNIVTNHVLQTVLSSVGLVIFLLAVPSISFAAKAAPTSGVGGLPHQSPLQPLPHGVGANISNNIQQTDASGPPDSAHTITPVGADAVESGADETMSRAQVADKPLHNSSGRASLIVMWVLIIISLAAVAVWLWFTTYRQASK